MDCALKSSLRPEMAVKATQQTLLDDLWTVNGQAATADDFFVDDLLDFSKDAFVEQEEEEEEEDGEMKGTIVSVSVSVPLSPRKEKDNESKLAANDGSVPGSELCVPADDLADLEWLSNFVDDSFSGYSLTYPAGKMAEMPWEKKRKPEIVVSEKPFLVTPVQTKARSKRARTDGRVWSLASPGSMTESSTTSSSSTSSCTSSMMNPWLIFTDVAHTPTAESLLGRDAPQKQRKKPVKESSGGGERTSQPRRCTHCGVQKTPQWRTGPLGAKTLCNACGVRFKSGRLLPEYRPACSPTFSSEVHSNNHRKVLEMRRKKEVETDFTPAVQSF